MNLNDIAFDTCNASDLHRVRFSTFPLDTTLNDTVQILVTPLGIKIRVLINNPDDRRIVWP